MRARDVRAILFCAGATLALLIVSYLAFRNPLASLALAAALAAWLVTRPRMQRVMRRMRGEADWSGYFKND